MANVFMYTTATGFGWRYFASVNTPDYETPPPGSSYHVNPDVSAVASIPVKYWKESAGAVVEMTAGEKQTVIDAEDIARSPMNTPVFPFNSFNTYQCTSADWPVNHAVPVLLDPANTALKVLQFDNGIVSGIGFNFLCPAGCTCLVVDARGRCATSPAIAGRTLTFQLRFRIIPDGAAINSWGQKPLDNVVVTQDVLYHKYLWIKNIASYNISDKLIQVQFVRRGDTDTLEFPWYAEQITFKFS